MENIAFIAIFTTLLFCLFKFVETRYLDKESDVSLKVIVRDSIVVFVSSVVAGIGFFYLSSYLGDFMNMVTQTKTLDAGATEIFTDIPGF